MFSLLTQKKCQLCSQLSSRLKQLIRRCFGARIDCQGINQLTRDAERKRVGGINAAAPDCGCEQFRMSVHSRGVVDDSEKLARFVFSPIQVDRKGKLKPSAFSHVYDKGCSVQRDSIAEGDEILQFINQFLEKRDDFIWKGILIADCCAVRDILTKNTTQRAACIYDTAERGNPSHAEICQTQHVVDEDDKVELRHDLLMAFGNQVIVPPQHYRNGIVLASLSPQFQTRHQ